MLSRSIIRPLSSINVIRPRLCRSFTTDGNITKSEEEKEEDKDEFKHLYLNPDKEAIKKECAILMLKHSLKSSKLKDLSLVNEKRMDYYATASIISIASTGALGAIECPFVFIPFFCAIFNIGSYKDSYYAKIENQHKSNVCLTKTKHLQQILDSIK